MSADTYVFDLDGTLTPIGADAEPPVLKALRELSETGATIVIATGRTLNAAMAVLDGAQIPGYVIAANGAVIAEYPSHTILHRTLMDHSLIDELLTLGENEGLDIALFRTHEIVMEGPGTAADHTRAGNSNVPAVFEPLREADWSDVLKVMYWAEPERLDVAFPRMRDKQPGIMRSMHTVAEMSSPGAAKEDALTWLFNYLGKNLGDALGIGDSGNDLGWLPLMGRSVAPGNSTPEVKALVDEVIGSQESGAVTDYITHQALTRQS